MLVFISWSGPRSKFIAEALENWLAQVIQAVEPWISQDIDKGLRWGTEIADRLEHSKVGIICLTKGNLDSKWIHFESGALSKTKDAYVCTLLLDVNPAEVDQPLAQFQHTTAEKEQVFKLLKTINKIVEKAGERALPEPRLREVFETYWPRLEKAFQQAATIQESTTSPSRPDSEMLREILEIVREQERRQNPWQLHFSSPYIGPRFKVINSLGETVPGQVLVERVEAKDESTLNYASKYGLDNFLIDVCELDSSYVYKGFMETNSVGEFLDYISRASNLNNDSREDISRLYTLSDPTLTELYNTTKHKVSRKRLG